MVFLFRNTLPATVNQITIVYRRLGNSSVSRSVVNKLWINKNIRNFSTAAPSTSPVDAIPTSKIIIGVPKEDHPGEKRIAQTPETVAQLIKKGFQVQVEKGAGESK